ncbi:MAG: hypothetical protein RL685_4636 [Pseudomonadota bacterium]|jgi:osmotically-inducible protein OsmY
MSNRYDQDPPREGRNRDYARREERFGTSAGRREEEEAHPDYRANWDDDRRLAEGPFPHYRSDNRSAEQSRNPEHRGPDFRGDYRNPDYRSPEHRSSDYRNAEQRNQYRPEEHRSVGSSYSRDYGDGRSRGVQGYSRGVIQEQGWSRDPQLGNLYGYEYGAHWPASGAGSEAYHRPVRWRSESELGKRESSSRTGSQQEWRGASQAGKGPKGYVRSDERIREDVCDRLSDDDELDASEITVSVAGGEVRLEGTVIDRYSKHRAEDVVEAISGVRDVTNNLRARKGFFQELGDKISGDDKAEHRGHSGAGPHNNPAAGAGSASSPRTGSGFSANR